MSTYTGLLPPPNDVTLALSCRCAHCHSLDRILKEAARELAPRGVRLARVDTSTETTLKKKYNIAQVPTLKVFRKEQVFNYDGPNEDKGAQGLPLPSSSSSPLLPSSPRRDSASHWVCTFAFVLCRHSGLYA